MAAYKVSGRKISANQRDGETWVDEGDGVDHTFINFKFTSKELDEETGLYYFGARYLDPQTSRWISPDPIYDGLREGLSIYGYCKNNPLIYHDPTGLEAEENKFKKNWNKFLKWRDENGRKDLEKRVKAHNEFMEIMENGKWYEQLWALLEGDPILTGGTPPVVGKAGKGTVSIGKLLKTIFKNPKAVGRYLNIKRLKAITGLKNIPKSIKAFLSSLKSGKKVSVIGPRNNYRQFAKEIGANYLDVTDEAWTWAKNEKFLQGIVNRGDDVIFAGKFDPKLLDPKSVLAQEINFLERRGYKWVDNFTKMIKNR